jgi:large subunit ribosomal protein L13
MRQTKMANWDIEKKWYVVDATDLVLGRMSTVVATKLMGKDKPQYTPHLDLGDFVIIVNAEKVKLTGNKEKDKMYYNHSGYPGGLRKRNAATMRAQYPEEMIYRAIKGMIPHNRLGRKMIKKLYVYKGSEHSHQAQKPETLEIK